MTSMSNGMRWTGLLLCWLALASCASTPLGKAKQGAAASHEVYESVTPQMVEEIAAIVEKSRAGTITQADRERLRKLNELKGVLVDYAAAHNVVVQTLQIWEQSGEQPGNWESVRDQAVQLIQRARTLARELNLSAS